MDPNRVKAIEALPIPSNKKALQSFLGQINFVRKFINNFSESVSLITSMLKKDAVFSWSHEAKVTFKDIKKAITEAPMLKNPDMVKDFIMYAYGVDKSIAAIVAQKDDNNEEHMIAYHSQTLHQH